MIGTVISTEDLYKYTAEPILLIVACQKRLISVMLLHHPHLRT